MRYKPNDPLGDGWRQFMEALGTMVGALAALALFLLTMAGVAAILAAAAVVMHWAWITVWGLAGLA